jgi:hypothetical protein
MPARNIYHDAVVNALVADGWTITDDPLRVSYGQRELYVDLGAERALVAAEKAEQKIAVEIQSFLNRSQVRDLQEAVGQYQVYRVLLAELQPKRALYLAVPRPVYEGVFTERFGQLIVTSLQLRLLVFDAKKETVYRWIN